MYCKDRAIKKEQWYWAIHLSINLNICNPHIITITSSIPIRLMISKVKSIIPQISTTPIAIINTSLSLIILALMQVCQVATSTILHLLFTIKWNRVRVEIRCTTNRTINNHQLIITILLQAITILLVSEDS